MAPQVLFMVQPLRQVGAALLTAWLLALPTFVCARNWDTASKLYDRGVQAYFSGSPLEAEALLSLAIGENPDDPRMYYFRALSRLQSGRVAEARDDMHIGALLEAQRPQRFAVGSALERVQGSHRLMLEQFRRQALAGAAAIREQLSRQRHEQIVARDREVLRERVIIPLEALLEPGVPRPLSPAELARRQAALPTGSASPPVPRPPAPSITVDDDPFRDDVPRQPVATPRPTAVEAPPGEPPPTDATDEDPFSF